MNEKKEEVLAEGQGGFDVFAIMELFWKNKFLLIALSIIVGCFFFIKTAYFTPDTYATSGMLYVSNKVEDANKATQVNSNDLIISRAMGLTYLEIIQTRTFLEDVSRDINYKYSWRSIAGMINVDTVNDTELVKISAYAPTADDAYNICNSIFKNAQDKLVEVYQIGKVEVVDKVYRPENPIGKGVANKTMIGLIFGFAIGAVFVFIRNMLDNKIHSGTDVAKKFRVSVLAEFKKENDTKIKNKKRTVFDQKEKIINEKSDFATVETLKSARTNIMFSIPKTEDGKVIVVTSSIPGEGKTTSTINLGITFAQTGAKVILVDCDLRKPRVHRYLHLERKTGLSDVLCGFAEIDKAIKKNVRPDFDVITSGEIPPNPAELLESKEFENVINALKEKYDYIFIDTPPVSVVADGVIAMRYSNGVVVAAKGDLTTYDCVEKTIEKIDKVDAKMLGVVLIDSDIEQSEKYKRYNHYMGYGYGYRDNDKDND